MLCSSFENWISIAKYYTTWENEIPSKRGVYCGIEGKHDDPEPGALLPVPFCAGSANSIDRVLFDEHYNIVRQMV